MKKYFFPALMAVLILSGIVLTATPYIADMLFPVGKTSFQSARPEDTRQALASWFGTPLDAFSDAHGIKRQSAHGGTEWFAFSVARKPMEAFIYRNHLQQRELTSALLHNIFLQDPPPVDWWQPASLQRQTYFSGMEEGQELGLVYDAELQRGFLIVRSRQKSHDF